MIRGSLADLILLAKVHLVVDRFCLSACSGYLFTAAEDKVVLPGALVGFHGGPAEDGPVKYVGDFVGGETPPAAMVAKTKLWVRNIVQRQNKFFGQVGVDGRLIYYQPGKLILKTSRRDHEFWEYGPATLQNKFHVKGIRFMEPPLDEGRFTRFLNALTGHASCQRIEADAWACHV